MNAEATVPSARAVPDRKRLSITITGGLAYKAWGGGALPPAERLAGGILSVPVPMTDRPLRYTLVYVIESPAGPVLIDAGWPDDVAWEALTAGLATADLTPADVHGVLVTHAHSDHHGLAGRIREVSGCWIGMHPRDIDLLRQLASGQVARQRSGSFLDVVGAPDEECAALRMGSQQLRELAGTIPDRVVEDGARDLVAGRALTAHWTPGHTPGHLVFVDDDLDIAFTGDHLLPRITSHVGSYDIGADVLGDYLDSLAAMDYLTDATEVLPAHEYRFRGARARIAQLAGHHAARLAEIEAVVATLGSATAWQIAGHVRWSRGWDETTGQLRRMALSETIAHLRHLQATGAIQATNGAPVYWSRTEEVEANE
jgi:glyoxylase-like metal-dependent hydrolase (beta-lactamase superfamily II)